MKTGDEVYIKSEGEDAVRWDVNSKWLLEVELENGFLKEEELTILKPTDRLVSELPEIARMTGCYVAVNSDKEICFSEWRMQRSADFEWHVFSYGRKIIPSIAGTITCPNCEDYTRQWGPDGKILK